MNTEASVSRQTVPSSVEVPAYSAPEINELGNAEKLTQGNFLGYTVESPYLWC